MKKITYREKVIAIVFTVIAILAAGAVFLVKPQIETFQGKQIELETKQEEKKTVETKIDTLPRIQMNIIQSLQNIQELQEPFYVEAKDYELEQQFHEYCNTAEMNISRMAFELSPLDLLAYQYMPTYGILGYDMKIHADLYNLLPQEVMDVYNEVKLVPRPSTVVGAMVIDVEFENGAAWEDYVAFLDLINELERTIIVNSVSLASEPDALTGEGGSVNMIVTIFNITPMDIEAVIEHEREIAEENDTLDELNVIIEKMRDGTLEPLIITETTAETAATTAE
jgi:Tfp pilus assembly protein PilO